MDRRKFMLASSLTIGSALLPPAIPKANSIGKIQVVKPKKLVKGDVIGLIAPGSGVNRSSFEEAIATLKRLGFTPFYTQNIRANSGYLAGTDQQRVDDIHHMFSNKEVKGILCIRGGYGSNRLLPMIKYDVIRDNPKVLIGYSDITALLFGIYSQTGLVGFHGPVGISSYAEYSESIFSKELIKAKDSVVIKRPKSWDEKEDIAYKPYVINSGVAQGQLVGGNLSVFVSLIGTPYDIDFKHKILFIEEIGESPYRVDRMLTQLLLAGKLAELKGIALGIFKDCDYDIEEEEYDTSFSLKEVLKERLSRLSIPIVYGLPFGHIKDNATIPFGIMAELNTDKYTLAIMESAVL